MIDNKVFLEGLPLLEEGEAMLNCGGSIICLSHTVIVV